MIILPTFRGVLSGFSPLSLAPALWLDAESLSGSDGTQISTWADRSGNSRDATQATSASQPKLYNSVLNGKKVVRFDGSDDHMITSSFSLSQPFTSYVVFEAALSAANKLVLRSANSTELTTPMVHRAVPDNLSGINCGTGYFPLATIDTWQILGTIANGTSSVVRRNGGADNIGDAGTGSLTQGLLIANRSALDESLNGDIAEILIFPTALSTTNRQRVERYLSSKWGIALA